MKPLAITQHDRRTICQFLRKQGIEVRTDYVSLDILAERVSVYYQQELPPSRERLALLCRFLEGINRAAKPGRVPPQEVPVFSPLKVSRLMQEALDRCKEAHPDVLFFETWRTR